jgi:hypothetical protein
LIPKIEAKIKTQNVPVNASHESSLPMRIRELESIILGSTMRAKLLGNQKPRFVRLSGDDNQKETK